MEGQILMAELIIGTLGYFVLLVSGSKAVKAAGRGKRLLPFLFRVLAVLVVLCHIKFIYFNIFGLKLFSEKLCLDYKIDNCTIAQVVDTVEIASKHKNLVVEFRDKNNHLVTRQLEKSSEYYEFPEVGKKILVRINYRVNSHVINSVEAIYLAEHPGGRRFRFFLSLFIIVFSVWIELKIRKQKLKFFLHF